MTKEQIETFLSDTGVAFSSLDPDQPDVIDFKNRGTSLRAIAYAKGDLLHLTCTYKMPATQPSVGQVHEIFQAIELEFPIVKLSAAGSAAEPTFTVSAEQLNPDAEHVGGVFWRLADLLVRAADECYIRLASPPAPVVESQPDALNQFIERLEHTLRQGCSRADSATGAADTDDVGVYERVKAALALLITNDGSTGSAFCITSGPTASYYVTNAHLTRTLATVTLYRQKPGYEKMEATVIAEGEGDDNDVAIVRVDSPNIPPLKLAAQPPRSESQIALAGYARVQIWAAQQFGELIPSVHFGTVTGVLKGGSYVLHDVICRPGDSGGPLFDPVTGDVVGVQKGGWQEDEEGYAVGARVLASFLKANKVGM